MMSLQQTFDMLRVARATVGEGQETADDPVRAIETMKVSPYEVGLYTNRSHSEHFAGVNVLIQLIVLHRRRFGNIESFTSQ